MSVREVLGEAWRLYRGHWRHLVAVALVAYAALALLPIAVPLLLGPSGFLFVGFFVLGAFFWVLGVLVHAANDVRDGYADLTVRQTLRRTGRSVNALGAAALFGLLAIGLALGVLVVPGVLLLTWWALVVPAIVLERASAPRSFRRSRWLVHGSRLAMLGVLAAAGLGVVASWGGAAAAAVATSAWWRDALPAIPRLPEWLWAYGAGYVVLVLASAVTTPFLAAALTVAYFRLRDLRGPGPPVRVKLGVGAVLGEAWRLYTRYPQRLLPVTAVLFAVLALAELAAGFFAPSPAQFPVVFAVTTVGFLLLHCGVLVALPDLRGGAPAPSLREIFRRVGRRFFPVLGAWLLVTLFVTAGLLFFVLPGLVLLTYWSLITPAILLERRGIFDSFPRSARLVGGNGLRVFLVLLPTVLIWNLSLGAVELAPVPPFLYVTHVMANTLLMPYLALAWTVAYYRLRDLPEAA